MIITNSKSNALEIVGENTSKSATINTSKLAKLQYILTEGLYSDAQSATIVELTNNGVDSIIESGKDPIENPVVVTLTDKSLSIKDNGVGMDKNFFENFFMSMLSSTKEDSNEYIGSFGLGSKSWASLKRSVTFTIVKNGTKCKYLCYRGEELIDYDLLLEEETQEENGVLFEMPINGYYEYSSFSSKAKQKLAYYDTVVLIIDGNIVSNQIYRNDLFQYTLNPPYGNLHLCLKDVVYSIDWSKLGISNIGVSIALTFNLDSGINVTPSREAILYSKETIDLIKNRIADVADYFIQKYSENVVNFQSFYPAYKYINQTNIYLPLKDKTFEITDLLSNSSLVALPQIKVDGMELRSPSWYKYRINDLLSHFVIKGEYSSNGVWKTTRIYTSLERKFRESEKIALSGPLAGNLKEFCKEKIGRNKVFVEYKSTRSLHWYRASILASIPKNLWRKHIVEWQKVCESMIKDWCIDLRKTEDTSEYTNWLERRKILNKENRGKVSTNYKILNKQEGEVTLSSARAALVGSNYTFEKSTFKIKDLVKFPGIIIVFKEEEKEFAKKLAKIVKREKIALIGIRDYNLVKHIPQIKTYEEFMSTKPFKRLATAILIEKTLLLHDTILRGNNEIIKNCLEPLFSDIETISKYKRNNLLKIEEEASKIILEAATSLNAWDEEILPVVRKVEKAIGVFDFIKYMDTPKSWNDIHKKGVKTLINQMLLFRKKYYKDLENYELIYVPLKKEDEII